MQIPAELTAKNWWTIDDIPIRNDSQVSFLIDGRHTLWTMCLHLLTARRDIYLGHWGLTPLMQLIRGLDRLAGPEGSPARQLCTEELQATGLSAEDITFWYTYELTLQNVLGYAVSKGVDVKVLLWDCPEVFSHYSPKTAHKELIAVGVKCLLDDSARHLPHPSESLHQKIMVVDGTYAFVGGIDPLIELSGDFDRWDTPWHNLVSNLRHNPKDTIPHAWHDAHTLITGTAAQDVEFNFCQRWNEVAQRHKLDEQMLAPVPVRVPKQSQDSHLVQITRTIPAENYTFTPKDGIQGIAQSYANAFKNVQNFVYLENQYFWLRAFMGFEFSFIGRDNPEMEHNLKTLAQVIERGASLAIVLPDHPNVGRPFTDEALHLLRERVPDAAAEGRIQAFCLAQSANQDGKEEYRPIYVHAKVAVIDDVWSTIGSANLNNRGMRDDAEMNVMVLNTEFAHNLRILLWAEHLGMLNEYEQFIVSRYLSHQYQHTNVNNQAIVIWQTLMQKLGDPATGMRLMIESAQTNLQHFKNGEPLVGHIFPYVTQDEAKQLGLKFHEEHGLLEIPEQK